MSIRILIFTEGDFHGLHTCETTSDAEAFTSGFSIGANAYGAGSANAYIMPEEESDMRDVESAQEVDRALTALADREERDRLAESDAEST